MTRPKSYERVAEFVRTTPWAILPSKLEKIVELIRLKNAGEEPDFRAFAKRPEVAAFRGHKASTSGAALAVIPVFGTIVQRGDMFTRASGGTSAEQLSKDLHAALNDDEISGIVLEIDSPGGSVFGVHEVAREIYEARGEKPIVAAIHSLAASAAYWIASAADEVVITPSGMVGSIGVYQVHEDWSEALKDEGVSVTLIHAGEFKVEGNPYEPLSDEAKARIQAEVDHYYELFTGDVAEFRGVSVEDVKKKFGGGRVLMPHEMLAAGGIDRIETFSDTLDRVFESSLASSAGNAAATHKPNYRALEMEIECLESEI